MRRPRHAILLAMLLLGALWFIAPEAPSIEPAQAQAHEGRQVQVAGVVTESMSWSTGSRFVIAHAGHGLEVRADGPAPSRGAWVDVMGRLDRLDGALLLWAEAWHVTNAPETDVVPLAALAQDPEPWMQRRIGVQADMGAQELTDGRHALRLQDGPRLRGPVTAFGVLAYDARCLCHAFHVDAVTPWISSSS